ncbi:MFS general substrate transporter [Neoconidiobolus thromboides FSU 785]|nr:MFS general substrate transporter [Neoconidiobolus thromboides FSU 785]
MKNLDDVEANNNKTIVKENEEERDIVGIDLSKQKITRSQMIIIMLGLSLTLFIAALDNTVVSTSLTIITSEFNSLDQITWVAASYLLTSTVLQPLYGKFSDIFGRKPTILFALISFLIGSIVCGVAQNIIILIVFRAIAGIGGGGLISIAIIIISDMAPMQTRGIYMGIVGAIFALASVVGPLIGGAFSEGLSWRWAFYINIPICVITIAIILFFLKLPKTNENFLKKFQRIDYLGASSLIIANTCLVLALNWGGKDYSWDSFRVVFTIIIAVIMFAIFIIVEIRYAIEPIVPGYVLNRNTISANLVTFFNGFTLMVSLYYIPLYYQIIKGSSAIYAGLELLPFLLGVIFASIFSGIFASKTGSYRVLPIVGTTLVLVGVILFGTLLRTDITRVEEILFTLIIGVGLGLCVQTNTIICQCAVEEKDVAIVTALVNFTQSLGSVLGLAVQGSVFSNILLNNLSKNLPAINTNMIISNAEELRKLTSEQSIIVSQAYIQAFKYLYYSLIGFQVLAFVFSLFVKHIPFRKGSNITVS